MAWKALTMIFRVEIENFHSIRDRQILDLTVSGKVARKPERFVPIYPGADIRVPKVIATFGANGAGKSNLLRAIAFLAWFVRDSFQLQPDQPIPVVPFKDEVSLQRETRFAVSLGARTDLAGTNSWKTDYSVYEYELVVRHEAQGNRNYVAGESLRHRPHGRPRFIRVFERSDKGEVLDGENFPLTKYRSVIDKVRANASVVSTLAQFGHPPSLLLRAVTKSVFTNVLFVKNELTDEQILGALALDANLLAAVNRDIPRVDLGIKNVQIAPGPLRPDVQFFHQGLDFPVPWIFESHGTQSFIRSFPRVSTTLTEGGLALIDEFDASLHPLMLAEVVRWFYDVERNPRNARLWITCQNASLLEELEKEEIVFCAKDNLGRTRVFGLQDIEDVRRIDNYYRKYLSGTYGAIPTFG